MMQWSVRSRAAIFVLMHFLVAAVIGSIVVVPILNALTATQQEIEKQHSRIARLRALAGQEAQVTEALAQQASSASEFVSGANEGVLDAELQARLKQLVESAGCVPRSVAGLAAASRDGVKYIGARIHVSGPLRSHQQALHAIESAYPFMFVTNLVLRRQAASDVGAQHEPAIEGEYEITQAVQPGRGGKP